MADEPLRNDFSDFEAEHAKRDRQISAKQMQLWAEGLISCLPDSMAYRSACTPEARLKEQALLNELVERCKGT